MMAKVPTFAALLTLLALSACSLLGPPAPVGDGAASSSGPRTAGRGSDVALFALGLIETGYRFGGKNPDAGLDCSGMVSYVFAQAAGVKLSGSAADMARQGRAVDATQLQPGDLVFFNTLNRPHSHVGIYIGDGRFIHAPSSAGKVRTESLRQGWFASRFEEARSYLD